MSRKKLRSSSFSNSIVWPKEDDLTNPPMEFDFSGMISELNEALKEKNTALSQAEEYAAELERQLRESENGSRKLLEQVERLQIQVENKASSLEHSKQENYLLRENLHELKSRADELENATIAKDSNLQLLERNLYHVQEESDALKRTRAATNSLIKNALLDNEVLSEEVELTRRDSIVVQKEAVKLRQQLMLANDNIESLETSNEKWEQRAKEIQKLKDRVEEENHQLRNELFKLRLMVENKTFELIDAQRDLEYLREQIGESLKRNDTFVLEQPEDLDGRGSREASLSPMDQPTRKMTASVTDAENMQTSRRNSMDCDTPRDSGDSLQNQSLLVLIQQSEGYGDRQSVGDEKGCESENDDGLELRSQNAGENNLEGVYRKRSSALKRDASAANKEMLVVFTYLTAAAVKLQYVNADSKVDIKTRELIELGEDMPFWEQYPFFVRVIKSLQEKNATAAQNEERKSVLKLSNLFSWRKKERKKRGPVSAYV